MQESLYLANQSIQPTNVDTSFLQDAPRSKEFTVDGGPGQRPADLPIRSQLSNWKDFDNSPMQGGDMGTARLDDNQPSDEQTSLQLPENGAISLRVVHSSILSQGHRLRTAHAGAGTRSPMVALQKHGPAFNELQKLLNSNQQDCFNSRKSPLPAQVLDTSEQASN